MKRLLFAAGMALILHGLLLIVNADYFKRAAEPIREPEPIRVALTYKIPEKRSTPVSRTPDRPKPKPPPRRKRPEKGEIKIRPPDIGRIRPVVKKTMKKEPIIPDRVEPAPAPALPPEESPGPAPAAPVIENIPAIPVVTPAEAPGLSSPTSSLPLKVASPLYRENPVPEYPRTARRRGYEGTVMLEVLVNTRGRVDDLRLHQSSGYAVLDRAAMRSVRGWIFEPGRRGDKEVEMWVKVPVRFDLRDP